MYSVNDTPKGWVAPFGYPRIKACSRLPMAFRSVPRPSSPPGAKASTECPSHTPSQTSVIRRQIKHSPQSPVVKPKPQTTSLRTSGQTPNSSSTQHNSHNAPDHCHRIKRDDPCHACTRHDPFRSDKSPNAATDQSCHRPSQCLSTNQTATELLQRTQGRTRTRFTTQKNNDAGHSPSGKTAMPAHPTLSGARPTSRRSRIQPIRHNHRPQASEVRPQRDKLTQNPAYAARRLAWRLSDSNR